MDVTGKVESSSPKFVCTDNCADGLCIFKECHSGFINIEQEDVGSVRGHWLAVFLIGSMD